MCMALEDIFLAFYEFCLNCVFHNERTIPILNMLELLTGNILFLEQKRHDHLLHPIDQKEHCYSVKSLADFLVQQKIFLLPRVNQKSNESIFHFDVLTMFKVSFASVNSLKMIWFWKISLLVSTSHMQTTKRLMKEN